MQGVEADDGARPALRRLAEIGDGEGVVPAGQAGEIVEYFLGRAILVGVDVTGRFDRGAVVDAKGDHAVIGAGAGDDRDTGAVESESCRVPPPARRDRHSSARGAGIAAPHPRTLVRDSGIPVVDDVLTVGGAVGVKIERGGESGVGRRVGVAQPEADEAWPGSIDSALVRVDGGALDVCGLGGVHRIGGCQPWQGALEVTDLFLHRDFVGEGAFFVEGGTVVVGGEAGSGGSCPSPVRPALEHVVVECRDAIADGGDAPLSGECGIGERGAGGGGHRPELGFMVAQGVALTVTCETQWVGVVGVEVGAVFRGAGEVSGHGVVVGEQRDCDAVGPDVARQCFEEGGSVGALVE